MKLLNQEELNKIKASLALNKGKAGSRKEAIKAVAELVKANKGKVFSINSEDTKPNFSEGFTEGFLEQIAQDLKVKVILQDKIDLEVDRKGEKTLVPRFLSAIIEA